MICSVNLEGVNRVSADWFDIEDDGVEADVGGVGADGGDFLFGVVAAEVGGGVHPEHSGLESLAVGGGLGDADFGHVVMDADGGQCEGSG